MAKNWISSPLGIHLLLNLNGKHAGKYFNTFDRVMKLLGNKKEFVIKNKIFQCGSNDKNFLSEMNNKFNLEKENYTSPQETCNTVKNWVNQHGDFKQFKPENYNFSEAKALLTNICMYKGVWTSAMVNVYNSFSYTEDIKYVVRLLVVRTCDDEVSFAIVVPNEADVLCHLVQKLHEEGLSAALTTIQPAFTATCKQNLPSFQFNSNILLREPQEVIVSQHGYVTVNQTGIDIKVLTCLLVGEGSNKINSNCPQVSNDCFSFAVVFKDVSIFTGQVLP